MSSITHYSFIDRLVMRIDQAVRALCDNPQRTAKPYPAEEVDESNLSDEERAHAAALMRVNHAGEICAQALYEGHAIVSRNPVMQQRMEEAAKEEGDHLAWCKQRLDELDSHTSYLKPVWYVGSLAIGMVTGALGDKWSLGFVAETERQVINHLSNHRYLLPKEDLRSHKILKQMELDEAKHRESALAAGGMILPSWTKRCMALTAKIMVKTAYWI